MATNFPGSLDTLTNPTGSDKLDSPDHANQHADINDGMEAVQAKVGADGSAVTSSIDYKLTNHIGAGGTAHAAAIAAGASGFLIGADKTKLDNTSGTNTGDETTATLGGKIAGATLKATPIDADSLGLSDSTAANIIRKLTWANLKATLKTYFDTLYTTLDTAYATSAAESSITGTTAYQVKVTANKTPTASTIYAIHFTAQLASDVTNTLIGFRVRTDATTTIFDTTLFPTNTYTSSGWRTVGGVVYVTLSAAAHTVTLEYNIANAARTTYIRQATIVMTKIG